jgi:hypothetical protein
MRKQNEGLMRKHLINIVNGKGENENERGRKINRQTKDLAI